MGRGAGRAQLLVNYEIDYITSEICDLPILPATPVTRVLGCDWRDGGVNGRKGWLIHMAFCNPVAWENRGSPPVQPFQAPTHQLEGTWLVRKREKPLRDTADRRRVT